MKGTDNFRLLAVVLVAAISIAACLALVHNHYSESGSRFDPNCPICQVLMGFILLLTLYYFEFLLLYGFRHTPLRYGVKIPYAYFLPECPRAPPTC